MSDNDFITEFHSLTTEHQLEFMHYIKEFNNGKDLYEIMTCDTLPKWLAHRPQEIPKYFAYFMGRYINFQIHQFGLWLRKWGVSE